MYRWRYLWNEPYRPFFLVGLMDVVVVLLLWWARFALDMDYAWASVPAWIHAHWMIWGVLQAFIYGFGLTAFPKQNQASVATGKLLAAWATLFAAGQALIVVGGVSSVFLLRVGVVVEVALAAWVLGWMGRIALRTPKGLRQQPWLFVTALAVNALAMLASGGVLAGWFAPQVQVVAESVALYGAIPLAVASTAWRVLPFFIGGATGMTPKKANPRWLVTLAAVVAVRAGAVAVSVTSGTAPWVVGVLDAATATLLGVQVWGWFPRRLTNPMIDYIFLGLAWLSIGFGFSAAENLRSAIAGMPYAPQLSYGSGHLLAIGGLLTAILAIATRALRGHAGLPIRADGWLHIAIWLVQASAVIRVSAPIMGSDIFGYQGYAAALPLVAAFAIWGGRNAPLLFYRADAPGNSRVAVPIATIRMPVAAGGRAAN